MQICLILHKELYIVTIWLQNMQICLILHKELYIVTIGLQNMQICLILHKELYIVTIGLQNINQIYPLLIAPSLITRNLLSWQCV